MTSFYIVGIYYLCNVLAWRLTSTGNKYDRVSHFFAGISCLCIAEYMRLTNG